jgi:hypothetical protein
MLRNIPLILKGVTMKYFNIVLIMLFAVTAVAQNNTEGQRHRSRQSAKELAAEVNQLVANHSHELSFHDQESVKYHLATIRGVFRMNGLKGDADKLVCLSDGYSGSSEQFRLHDIRNKKDIGRWTSKQSCEFSRSLLSTNVRRLTCLSDGYSGSSEQFRIYDLNKAADIGRWTSKDSCQSAVETSYRGLVCLSDGYSGSSEQFKVYDLDSGESIGRWTSKQSCLDVVRQ